jgi:cytoskeletal protein RodZ
LKSNLQQTGEGKRYELRAKRRRTNRILNGLIALVILLIIIVSMSIFSGNDDKGQSQNKEPKVENKVSQNEAVKADQPVRKDKEVNASEVDEEDKAETAKEEDVEKDEPQVTEGGSDGNVKRTIVDPSWEPIGTQQSGPFSSEDVDWEERVDALAYAIGVDKNNMTVWYLQRNGQYGSIGTVTEKGNPQAYRVYLEWKDGEGWMPTKVEELYVNDKR